MLHVKKNLKQRLLSGGAWSFVTKVGVSFLTIALAAITVRLLPPADVGVFFLSYSIIILLSLFARFGLDRFCVRYIGDELAAHRYHAARELVNVVILVVFGISSVIALLLYFLFDIFVLEHLLQRDPEFSINVYLAIWLVITSLQFLFAEIFRAYHNIKYASLFSGGTIFGGFTSSILFGLVLAVGYATDSSYSLEEILQVLFAIMTILLIIEYRIMRVMVNKYCELDDTKKKLGIGLTQMFCNALPFFISSISFMFLIHADTVILGLYEEESEVAIYNAATRIAKLSIMMFMIINEVIMPVIVELNAKSEKEKMEYIFRVASTIAVIFSLLTLLLFIFFGEYLLAKIYGEFYKSGALLLVIMGVGQLITVAAGSSEIALTMMGFQKVNMYISLVTSLLAVLAFVLVAPVYGSVAVASVVAIALILRGTISTVIVHKLSGVSVYAKIFIGTDDVRKLVRYAKK